MVGAGRTITICVKGSLVGKLPSCGRWSWLAFTWRRGTLRGRRCTWSHPPSFCVAGVALGNIYLRFAWQVWHLWHRAGSRGALGAVLVAGDAAAPCVAGVALGDIHLCFAWQAWHLATSTLVLRGRRGTWWHAPSFRVAGVALGDIHLRFAWQAWHLRHWAGSGGALGQLWSPVTPRHFAWQVWHLATCTVVSRGRRGTYGTGLALRGRRGTWWHAKLLRMVFTLQLASHATWRMFRHVKCFGMFLCMTTFFACRSHCCQAPAEWGWHRSYDGDRHSLRARYVSVWLFEMWLYMSLTMVHQMVSCNVCGIICCRDKKYRSQQGVRSCFGRAMLSSLFCLEIMLKRATFHVYCCVKIFGDIGDLAMLVTFACDTCVRGLLKSRLLRAKEPMMCLTRLLRVPPRSDGFFPDIASRHSHTTLSHTLSFTHNLHTRHISQTTLSHTHHLSLSHNIFHIRFCHLHFFYLSILHHLLCLSFLPRPPYNICRSLLEEVDLWGYPVL